jgi:hypothetical protein
VREIERERERESERTNGDLLNNYYFYNNVLRYIIYLNIRKRQHVLIDWYVPSTRIHSICKLPLIASFFHFGFLVQNSWSKYFLRT